MGLDWSRETIEFIRGVHYQASVFVKQKKTLVVLVEDIFK